MRRDEDNQASLAAENEELRRRLAESEETLRAIHSGEVDAVLVTGPEGSKVYTLTGAESPYRVLVEQMQEGALSLNSSGLILYCNRRFADLIDTPLEKVIGSHMLEFINPTDRAQYSALSREPWNGKASAELSLMTVHGTLVPVYFSVSRYDIEGTEGICATVTDLTEQKRNEEIVASERLARSILEQATEAIVVADEKGRIIRANRAAHDLAGRNILWQRFEEAFCLEPERVHANNDISWNAQALLAAAIKGETVRLPEALLVRAPGEAQSVVVGVGPLTGPAGELVGSVISLTNVTCLRRAEEVVSKANEELKRANSDLRQFAYSASHDLQEPLRSISIYSELLLSRYQHRIDGPGKEFLQYLRAGALRMESLIRDLLAYTHAASLEIPASECDAAEILSGVLANLSEAISESGAEVESERLPPVRMHDAHLQQLLQNLIGNALKYRSPERRPVVTVKATLERGQWLLSVNDNGIGIDEQYKELIFGLFKRLHSTEEYSGTGIGLAICHRIVERYQGRIWVESKLGQGSTFFVTIPQPGAG